MDRQALIALAMAKTHEKALESVLDQARSISIETAQSLRTLLAPVLQRWGVGLRKGGNTSYVRVGSDGIPIKEHVRLVSDEGYALKVVHPELYELLCTYNKVINRYIYHYLEDIPVPNDDRPWVWATREWVPTYDDEGLIDTTPCPSKDCGDPDREYYGPISQCLYDEVLAHGGDMVQLLDVLPQYSVGPDGVWAVVKDRFLDVEGE